MRSALVAIPSAAALLAACSGGDGDDTGSSGDGITPVVAVIDQWGDGVPGVLVAIHDSHGELVAAVWTGDNGGADVVPVPGGSITAYSSTFHSPSRLFADTVFRPGAGPVRFLVITAPPDDLPAATSYTVDVTGMPPEAVTVFVTNRCEMAASFDGLPLEMSDQGCPQYGDEVFFAVARDVDSRDLAWGMLDGVPKDPGGTVPVTIALSSTSFRPIRIEGVIPSGYHLPLKNGIWSNVRGFLTDGPGEWSAPIPTAVIATDGSGIHAWTPVLPDAPFEFWIAAATASYPTGDRAAFAITSSAADLQFDLGEFPFVAVAPLDAAEPARPVIRWTPASATTGAMMIVASSTWELESGYSMTFSGAFGPGDAPVDGELVLPVLPEEIAVWGGAPVSNVIETSIEHRRSSLVQSGADAAADVGRGLGGMTLFTGRVEWSISRAPQP